MVIATFWSLIFLFVGIGWSKPFEIRLPNGHVQRLEKVQTLSTRSLHSKVDIKQVFRDVNTGELLKCSDELLLYAPSYSDAEAVIKNFNLGRIKKIASGIYRIQTPKDMDILSLCQKIKDYNDSLFAVPNWKRERSMRKKLPQFNHIDHLSRRSRN